MDFQEHRLCYFVSEEQKDERGYIPLLIKEDVPGFKPMAWRWGPTKAEAQKQARQHNAKMGIRPEDVAGILASTME
jgi:hypothetical protein